MQSQGKKLPGLFRWTTCFSRTFHNSRAHIAWTQLISQHAKSGQAKQALTLYKQMRDKGLIPNAHTFVAALKACSSTGDLVAGKEIHAHVGHSSHEMNKFVACTLVAMYAKCGSIEDAYLVFEKMKHPDVVCWNAMIMGYAHMGMSHLALELYEQMQHQGPLPDAHTYAAVTKACCSILIQQAGKAVDRKALASQCLIQGKAIHGDVVIRGLESDLYVANTLMDMYMKCESLEDAVHIFENMRVRDIVSWNTMIMGYAQMEMGESALQLYMCMQHEGFMPSSRTFVAVLKACGGLAVQNEGKEVDGKFLKENYLKQGRAIHIGIVKGGLESDIFVANTLVDMYAKCGSLADARQVFEKMRQKDVVSWNAMITGYTQMEMGELALQIYVRMRDEGFTPDAHTFVAAIKACSLLGEKEAKAVDRELVKTKCLEKGRAIHAEIAKRRLESDVFIASTLVDMYVKCKSIVEARQVFDKMVDRNVVSWNSMIIGYAQMEMGESALELYLRMQREGYTPDTYTYVAALKACGNLAFLESGKEIHFQIHRAGLEDQPFIANCLVDMYSKCGSMIAAQQIFDSLLTRDSVTWSSLIAGYSGQGDYERVFYLYNKMQQEGTEPNDITFLSVLTGCNYNGLVDKGQMYFYSMCLASGMSPSSKHYKCMIDLLGRSGQLDEAVAIVKMIPFKHDVVTWMTILGACQKWHNVQSGRNAFNCAVMLDEKFAAAYVVMINIYVSARLWKESARIKEMRMKARAWENPGQ